MKEAKALANLLRKNIGNKKLISIILAYSPIKNSTKPAAEYFNTITCNQLTLCFRKIQKAAYSFLLKQK
jgi:hypothetical protein